MVVGVGRGVNDGLEDGRGREEGDRLAFKHLADGGVIRHAQVAAGNLGREVQVADFPGQKGCGGGIGVENHFKNRLRELLHAVESRWALVDDVAVGQGVLEIEAEVGVVGGDTAPAAFRESFAAGGDGKNGLAGFQSYVDMVMNENHF